MDVVRNFFMNRGVVAGDIVFIFVVVVIVVVVVGLNVEGEVVSEKGGLEDLL